MLPVQADAEHPIPGRIEFVSHSDSEHRRVLLLQPFESLPYPNALSLRRVFLVSNGVFHSCHQGRGHSQPKSSANHQNDCPPPPWFS